ncbi:Aspartic peptidase domain containing protein, partial [Naviculisporaceae sp. PSN 640]
IGTYGQEVTLDFDTGSSETWVSPPCSAWAPYPEYEDLCRLLGTYVPEQSSTAVEADCPSSWIMYGSGSVFIKYYTDTIHGWYNSPQLTDVQFGLATDATNMPSGIFGAAYGGAYNQDYPSIIDEMYNQSLIASKDFSVALGSVGEEDGTIVFGGIDLAKFSGPLHEYEISHQLPKTIDGYYRYWVNISSIGVTEPDSCVTVPLTPKGFSERFLPDTGTSLTYMPSYVFNSILKVFPDANMTYEFGYVVSCSHRERKGTIDYTFPDGFTVHVPYSEFIFVIPPGPSNGPVETCIIGAVPTDELFILGDTFLRSVYSVFSQDHHKIYFGNYKDCGTHVVPSRGLKNKGLKGDCP